MTNTLLDFSKKTELRWLGSLVKWVGDAAGDMPFFIAGAMARDLILQYGYGIEAVRKTNDVDFAFMVENWHVFEAMRTRMLATGKFLAVPGNVHRLQYDGFMAIDLVPFGAIEKPDRTIVWPSGNTMVMSVFGFSEAWAAKISVSLPEGVSASVVSLPALALLKLVAWMERRYQQPGKDAYDLWLVLQNYLDAGNHDRLYSEAAHLLEQADFDYDKSGAWLLGFDMGKLLAVDTKKIVEEILVRESNPHGSLALVGDIRANSDTVLVALNALLNGFRES